MKKSIILIFTFLISISSQAQKASKSKAAQLQGHKTVFGVAAHILPVDSWYQNSEVNFISDSIQSSITKHTSVSLGGEIRHFFTYRFAINTGLFFTPRNYKLNYSSHYTEAGHRGIDTTFSREMRFISFEIPVHLSGYVRLSRNIFMNVAGGINLNFYPTNIGVENINFQRIGLGGSQFFQLGYTIGIGWEFRTENTGYFYLGGLYQARFDNMGSFLFYERNTVSTPTYSHDITGSYLALVLKFYFPVSESDKKFE